MIRILGCTAAALAMTAAAFATEGVDVSGAVGRPGLAPVTHVQSLHEAVKQMGGFRLDADRRHVKIVSADGATRTVDATKLGIIEAVRPGDRVIVPAIDPMRSVLVQGGVASQGAYDYRPGMTVRDLIAMANPTAQTSLEKVRIYRPDKSGTVEVHTANLLAMNADAEALRPGDTVYVPRASASMSDRELLTIAVVGLILIVIFR